MSASDYSNPDSLGVLAAMVNQTLIDTGRFFQAKASTQSRAHLKRSIPAAHEQFQCALDNLSEQIFIAKAFLEKDYEAITAQKAALQPVEDVVMDQPEPIQEPEASPQLEVVDTKPQEGKPSTRPTVQSPVDVSTNQKGTTGDSMQEKEPAVPTASGSDQPQTGPADINFDAVLNDSGGANDFDLNLDFGDDDLGNETFLSGSNFGNTAAGGAPNQQKRSDQTNNMTSDITGPENNNNTPTGGDLFDLELKKTGVFDTQHGADEGQLGNGTEDIMAPGESSFDDLFMDNENFGGGEVGDSNMLEGDGLMNINELDDSWFT
ncbi:hypothetical protein BDV25DRAFT_66106 [Aspergillus avenaceus]|uniref:Uncharacterized protein n=1 Tax=Aspergillus avenaceus TaxID=36643 RepID=A0A5N6TH10_ASPAV|nr:hypothetical protein BDV25DRAFT_66106 [Aspergillus avenaceus]